ncbi:MAG: HAD-IA family hydrolase [Pseudonocardiaceae bacterium]
MAPLTTGLALRETTSKAAHGRAALKQNWTQVKKNSPHWSSDVGAPNPRQHGLILDFGGVLTTSFEGALRFYCVRDGLAPDALEKIFTLDKGAQGILVDLERMVGDLHPEPLVTAAVAELRSRGIKVAVLSNSWGSTQFDPYARFRLNEHYDTVVISDQVGLRKPDPEIFTLVLQRLGLSGED